MLTVSNKCRSEGFALTGYDIPWCMEDGAWMPWENSSAAAAVAAAVAHPGLKKKIEFHYGIGLPECADRSVQSSEAPTHEF